MKTRTKTAAGLAAAAGVAGVVALGLRKFFFPNSRAGTGSGSGSGTMEYTKYTKPGFNTSTIKRMRFLNKLKSKLGKPFIWGHTGPNSFDCSGYVFWGYGEIGVTVPRLVTEQSAEAPYSITFNTPQNLVDIKHLLKIGDCIGMDYEFGGRYDHVIMYKGGGWFIHASGGTACPNLPSSRCKVVSDKTSHFSGKNIRSIYSWV